MTNQLTKLPKELSIDKNDRNPNKNGAETVHTTQPNDQNRSERQSTAGLSKDDE